MKLKFSFLYQKVLNLFFHIIESCIRNISGRIGVSLRRIYFSKRFAICGKNLKIDEGVIIQGIKDIYVGDNVWIDKYSILIAGKTYITKEYISYKNNKNYKFKEGELHIGSNVHIAPQCIVQAHGGITIADYFTTSAGCKIYSLSNDVNKCQYGTHSFINSYYVLSPITVEENVWLGLNSILLGGTIGKNSFIAPNSTVWHDIKENSFATGSPAKRIKPRFKYHEEYN